MSCKSCRSENRSLFPSELHIHFPGGLKALHKQTVMVFSQLLVCLDCGYLEAAIPEAELHRLKEGSIDV